MKFRGDFQYNEYRLGHFYKSDVKNMIAALRTYPFGIDDSMRDLSTFVRSVIDANNTFFCSLKIESDMVGYGAFAPINNDIGQIHLVKRPMVRLSFSALKGVGRCLAAFGFEILKLRKITATVPVVWKPSAMIARMAGMKKEGTLRQAFSIDGKHYDVFVFGGLREEF